MGIWPNHVSMLGAGMMPARLSPRVSLVVCNIRRQLLTQAVRQRVSPSRATGRSVREMRQGSALSAYQYNSILEKDKGIFWEVQQIDLCDRGYARRYEPF